MGFSLTTCGVMFTHVHLEKKAAQVFCGGLGHGRPPVGRGVDGTRCERPGVRLAAWATLALSSHSPVGGSQPWRPLNT